MALTLAQRAMLDKARSLGGGQQGVALDDQAATGLVAVIAADLDLVDRFPELPTGMPDFFEWMPIADERLPAARFLSLFERLVTTARDTDTYFVCLATLYKSRLKYDRILQTQPFPTIDQVGPRGLLQYGKLTPRALTGFLFWRKWMFDIDNRAGQETGYLFEPIIASAIGGTPVSAARSPVYRLRDKSKSRQVDCIRGMRAYEIKIRVTIAASGQGRWQEELDFPADCRASGYTPVLLVLDPTDNPKLAQLARVFEREVGEVYIGEAAWRHLEQEAGPTMSRFIEKYVHSPIQSLLDSVPEELPELSLRMTQSTFTATVEGESFTLQRTGEPGHALADDSGTGDALPEGVEDQVAGP